MEMGPGSMGKIGQGAVSSRASSSPLSLEPSNYLTASNAIEIIVADLCSAIIYFDSTTSLTIIGKIRILLKT